ncbi:MAG TPA: LLM class flavin-dependent oxidoreductase [Pyrinomonadaceae bacterium]|nr:LLM class flavin-dependent oxidoreductase [Pyrinomonadaceae bacterium]
MSSITKIPFSVLDLSPVFEGETAAEALRHTLSLAQHAEKLGYNRFWLAEHHNMPGIASAATSVVIGYVAGGTSTIRVGSGGIMLSNHAPIVIAEQFGTLESLYPGRIDLGLGRAPGTDRPATLALRRTLTNDGEEFPEQLEELRFFFRETVENQKVQAVPGAGLNIPIWLLSSSGFSAHLAGILGLPFAFAAHFSPEHTQPSLKLYRQTFQPSDELQKPYAMVALNVIAAESDEEAEFLATSQTQSFLNLIRGKAGKIPPPIADMNAIWNEGEKALVASRTGGSIVGSRETVKRKLEEFLERTNADEIMVNAMIYDHQKRLRSYEIIGEIFGENAAKLAA